MFNLSPPGPRFLTPEAYPLGLSLAGNAYLAATAKEEDVNYQIISMNILIIGGTGFLSSRIAEKLLSKGHNITLLVRGKTKSKFVGNKNLSLIYGDRNDKKILSELVSKHKFDIVYDMIAYTENDSQTAIDVFNNKIGRFIHCSTISVYMLAKDVRLPVTEDQINLPLMEPFHRSPFGWDYGINKIKCEDVLRKYHNYKSFPVSILRPTYISGPGDPAKRDFFWIERILDGKPLLVPGEGNFKFQEVFLEDAADAFCKVIETDKSIGEAYNVAAEEVFTLNEYLEKLVQELESIAEAELDPNYLRPKINIDMEYPLHKLPVDILNELDKLEPLGADNSEAVFVSRGVEVKNARTVGKDENHLKLRLKDKHAEYDAIAFNQGYWGKEMPNRIDVVYSIERNHYNGNIYKQLRVKDLKPSF